MSPRGGVCTHHVAHACARMCVSVINGFTIFFRIYANLLNTVYLYTCPFAFICVMWDHLSIYFYVDNVA